MILVHKIISVSLAAVLSSTLLTAQSQITLQGTVQLDEPEVVVVMGRQELARIPVQDDKTFAGVVPLDRMRQISAIHGVVGAPIFAKPGRDITIHFGSERTQYELEGSPETTLYTDARFVIHPGDPFISNFMTWERYKRFMQQSLTAKMRYIEIFCQAHPDIPDAWRQEVEDFTIYGNYMMHVSWPRFHMQAMGIASFEEEDDWRNYLEELFAKIDWNSTRLLGQRSFISFAEEALLAEARKRDPDASVLQMAFQILDEKSETPEVIEFLSYQMAVKYLPNETPESRQMLLEEARQRIQNPNFLTALDRALDQAQQSGAGSLAFDFRLPDSEGNMVALSDFRGKIVYVDFWATWCGPCLAEMPHLKRLKQELSHRDDIVIVGVSTDRVGDHDKWLRMVKELELGANQLFAGELYGDIARAYQIRGIPHFVIIDREGRIHQNQTIRPSNPQTRRLLLGLADGN